MGQRFDVGDIVEWDAQARGTYNKRSGKVIHVLKEGHQPPCKIADIAYADYQRMFDGFGIPGGAAQDYGYFIEIVEKPTRKPKLYLPCPQRLRLVASATKGHGHA
jgi:hypothetical protein